MTLGSKTFRTLLILIVVSLSLGSPAASQELCLPDCQNSPWGPIQTHVLTLPGGCQVEVGYATRLACGLWEDTQIVYVFPLNFEHTSCTAVTVMEIPDFLALITEQMIEDDPMGFSPPTPTIPATGNPATCDPTGVQSCEVNFRVINGACWQKLLHHNNEAGDVATWAPCETTGCCINSYRVCVDACGNRTSEQIGAAVPPGACPTEPFYPCEPACGP